MSDAKNETANDATNETANETANYAANEAANVAPNDAASIAANETAVDSPVRPFYDSWPRFNDGLKDAIAGLTAETLAIRPSPAAWPLWATIGHLACQRVFWLCDFAGEPGKETTPFLNAAHYCPGDDDLVNVLDAEQLVSALDATFRIVERCLDGWTVASLAEIISRPEFGPDWVMRRGEVIQRVHDHDVWHAAQVSQTLRAHGSQRLDVW